MRPWDSLNDGEKRLFCRMAEVYAGFLSHADHEIGRLLEHLEQSGQLDNTIIVLVSDNGASGEGGPNGSVNENKLLGHRAAALLYRASRPRISMLGADPDATGVFADLRRHRGIVPVPRVLIVRPCSSWTATTRSTSPPPWPGPAR